MFSSLKIGHTPTIVDARLLPHGSLVHSRSLLEREAYRRLSPIGEISDREQTAPYADESLHLRSLWNLRNRSLMSTCPSCGRDAGTNEICPHCGADLKRRVRVRTFGIIAIVVAVAGVAVLLFFASRAPVPAVKVSDIESTSNYAYVQSTAWCRAAPTTIPIPNRSRSGCATTPARSWSARSAIKRRGSLQPIGFLRPAMRSRCRARCGCAMERPR